MKNTIFAMLALIGTSLFACSDKAESTETSDESGLSLENTERVVIHLVPHTGEDTLIQVLDTKEVEEWTSLASKKEVESAKCARTGMITYYFEEGTSMEADFNTYKDCPYFRFMDENGEIKDLKLTEEGRERLLQFSERG